MKLIPHSILVRAAVIIGALALCIFAGYRDTAHGGIQGSGIRRVLAIGRITSFGSIYVNGVEYSTAHAQVGINSQSGTESQLRVGQVVSLDGTIDPDGQAGTAADVEYFADARGPVSNVDIGQRTFEVLGQSVRITDETVFGSDGVPMDIALLPGNANVEVSGLADAAGVLIATRVDLIPGDESLQVKGVVAGLNGTKRTFHINKLNVDYSSIAPDGVLTNGTVVEVQGKPLRTTELQATGIEIDAAEAAAGAHGDVQGIISNIASSQQFSLGSQLVNVTSETKSDLHGQRLAVNLPVRVKGVFDAAGALVADKITAQPGSATHLTGFVESMSGCCAITAGGRSVSLTQDTVYEDKSALKLKTFGADDLAVGDYVEITGGLDPANQSFIAAVVKRTQPKDPAKVGKKPPKKK